MAACTLARSITLCVVLVLVSSSLVLAMQREERVRAHSTRLRVKHQQHRNHQRQEQRSAMAGHCGTHNQGTCTAAADCVSFKDPKSDNDCANGQICCLTCESTSSIPHGFCGNNKNQWLGICATATACAGDDLMGLPYSISASDKCPFTCHNPEHICCSKYASSPNSIAAYVQPRVASDTSDTDPKAGADSDKRLARPGTAQVDTTHHDGPKHWDTDLAPADDPNDPVSLDPVKVAMTPTVDPMTIEGPNTEHHPDASHLVVS